MLHIKDHASRHARFARLFDQHPDRPGIREAFQRLWATLDDLHIEGPVKLGEIRQYTVLTPTGYQWELTLFDSTPAGFFGGQIVARDENGHDYVVPAKRGDVGAIRNFVLHRVG